ncbi:MAG: EAL domain-containing protein [Ilumatobacteraceae bacterium]
MNDGPPSHSSQPAPLHPDLHPTLRRQLRRLGIGDGPPDAEQWSVLLERVTEGYTEDDRGRELLERSLDISTREMGDLYDELQRSSEHQIAFERDRLQAVFDAVSTALLVVDDRGVVNAANPEALRLLGPLHAVVGQPLETLLIAGNSEHNEFPLLQDNWRSTVMFQQRWQADDINLRPRGMEQFPADCVIVPFRGGATGGNLSMPANSAVVVITDNSDREVSRSLLEWQANHDVLTGLSNRSLVTDRLEHALLLAGRSGSWPAVLFIDLDRFKSVNDLLGHATGDRLLIEAARRIERSIRAVDTVARLGGDEFVILCEALERPDLAEQIAARILHALEAPFDFNGEEVFVSASIGIARGDRTTVSADDLIRQSDLAMYRAKENGRNRIETFDPAMHAESRRKVNVERALREALDNDELTVVYQPIFDTAEGALVAFEALVRWDHAEYGSIGPNEFIPLAEEVGLIAAVGERVLEIACRDAASWRETAHFPIGLHVNVSARQLSASSFVNYLARVLRHHHIEPSSLTLELTESVLLDNPERAATRLMALREIGVRVAIDDFGVGYSSLAYLRRFPLDVLKVDRQFVAGIANSPPGQHILQAIVDLAAGLDYDVIAEGVEQPEELVLLRQLGFQYAQGYLLAAPMPPAEALLLAAASAISRPAQREHSTDEALQAR